MKNQIIAIYTMFRCYIDEVDYLNYINDMINSLDIELQTYPLYQTEKNDIINYFDNLLNIVSFLTDNKKHLTKTQINILSIYINDITILQKQFECKLFENELKYPNIKD